MLYERTRRRKSFSMQIADAPKEREATATTAGLYNSFCADGWQRGDISRARKVRALRYEEDVTNGGRRELEDSGCEGGGAG